MASALRERQKGRKREEQIMTEGERDAVKQEKNRRERKAKIKGAMCVI